MRNTKEYKICKFLHAYIFRILQHFAIKLCNFTNFRTLFNAVVMNFTISVYLKILSIMQSVHLLISQSLLKFVSTSREKIRSLIHRNKDVETELVAITRLCMMDWSHDRLRTTTIVPWSDTFSKRSYKPEYL